MHEEFATATGLNFENGLAKHRRTEEVLLNYR